MIYIKTKQKNNKFKKFLLKFNNKANYNKKLKNKKFKTKKSLIKKKKIQKKNNFNNNLLLFTPIKQKEGNHLLEII